MGPVTRFLLLSLIGFTACAGRAPTASPRADGGSDIDPSQATPHSSTNTTTFDPPAQPLPAVCPTSPTERAFADVTACANIDAIHTISDFGYYAVGQAFGDYDRDGLPDLYVTDADGPNTLYHNEGDGSFRRSAYADDLVLTESESSGAIFFDFDNDGWRDLYVVGRGPNTLFRNIEGRGFVDVTEMAGVGDPLQGSSASVADYDGDGFLDLYVANWLLRDNTEGVTSRDVLYRNEGDGTFRDATHLLGGDLVSGAGFLGHFFDFDNDGDQDLYVANDKGTMEPRRTGFMNRNVFFRNDGPGCGGWCFSEAATEVGLDLHMNAMGLASSDYDGDGDLDVYVTNGARGMALLRNDGGRFTNVVEDAGVNIGDDMGHLTNAWGVAFLDYDNDGWPDIYVVAEGRNRLFRNLGNGRFSDTAESVGVDDTGAGLGLAIADYDRDGYVDLLLGNRGDAYRLLRNLGSGGKWVEVSLEGGSGVNRDAIGSRVVIHTSDGRTQFREVDGGSSVFAGNDTTVHFGLGDANIDSLEVHWSDGERTVLEHPESDREIRIQHPL